MAQPIDIQIERSLNNTPTTLLYGEPAWDDFNEKLYIGRSDGTPVVINPNLQFSFSDLTDGSSQVPNLGEVLAWDGINYAPNDTLILDQNGCSIQTIDDTGLDWCNHQIGNTGSAFTILKKSLGTKVNPLPLTNGEKIGGWGFVANDGTVDEPGFTSVEIASFVTENQTSSNGGAEMQISVTPNNTKTPLLALTIENDGTLNVAGQPNYESKVTLDDDIPNKKYVDDLFSGIGSAANLDAIQLRRTTVYNVINGAYGSINFNLKDVENNTSVLEQNSADTSEILIKETGLYLLSYYVHSDGNGSNTNFRVLLNNSSVVEGSQSIRNESGDTNRSTVGVTIAVSFNSGDRIELQAQTNTGGVVIDPPCVFGLVRLKGAKGDSGDPGVAGPAGTKGADGQAGFGIYAWSETEANDNQLDGLGLSVSSAFTGIYNYTFDSTAPSNTYNVYVQPVYNGTFLNTIEVEVYDKSTNGFTIRLNQQDDGGGAGSEIDFRHSVVVLGVGGGLPAGSIEKGTALDNEFIFFNGNTLNSNGSIIYNPVTNNINVESQNTNGSALTINTSSADADWLTLTYQNDPVAGFFGLGTDPGEVGLYVGDTAGRVSTVAYSGTVNTTVGYQINTAPLSFYHLGDTAASTQTASEGQVLIRLGGQWVNATPPITTLSPGTIRVSSSGSDLAINYNSTTVQPIVLSGPVLNIGNTSYFTNSNGSITCNFTGIVKFNYHIPHFSNDSRATLKTIVQRNGTDYGAPSFSYIRDADGHQRDDNSGQDYITVTNGDVLRIGARRSESSNRGGAITLLETCVFTLERIQ